MKLWRKITAMGMAAVLVLGSCAGLKWEEKISQAAEETESPVTDPSRVTVHDPSIIKADGTYYLFGSHMADAKSTNLLDWSQMNLDWNARETADAWKQDSVYGDVLSNYAESFEWAGYDDGNCSNGGLAIWAPDVIYNPYYEWKDGNKGAYLLYYSASSTWRRSCIGYAVSKQVEGPYQYVDTILYSGFSNNPGTVDGNSTRDTYWDNDYLNINELLDNGTLKGVSSNWFDSNGGWNASYAPNAIDPTVFFDKNGKLFMVYGSWSGGLFVQSLDEKTGAVNYPGTDGTEEISGNVVDRYFGTRIAGGNGQSGEGPYILYDEESDYYYLYESYGGLTADGGYNMRLFRSRNVYGPYLDAAGNNAKDNSSNNDKYGIKLIGNYQFHNQPGYKAAGHNSAMIDDDGSHYLVYHQRFPGKTIHEVRVRQQFMNEDSWPVAAVYEYRGEEIGHYDEEEIMGSYEIIDHGTNTDRNMLTSSKIELCADGTVTGDLTGTWNKTTDPERAYDYVTLSLNGITYKGYFFRQYNEKDVPEQVMTFSAMSDQNTCLWGTHRTAADLAEDKAEEEAQKTPVPTASPTVTPNSQNADSTIVTTTPKPTGNVEKTEPKKLKKPVLTVKVKRKKAVLSWKRVSGADGYQIWYSKNKAFKKAKKVMIKKGKTTKKTIKGIKKGKKMYFRIRAYRKIAGKKVYGAFSKVKMKR